METILQIIGAVLFFIGAFHLLFLLKGGIGAGNFPIAILASGIFLFIVGTLIKLVKEK